MQIKNEMEYTRKKQIGINQGMNADVWIVDEPQLGGELVVKEMPKSRFAGGSPAEFFQEAQAMFASNAPNVVPLHWAGQTPAGHVPELVCICMPYFKRGSLADRIATAPLPPATVLKIAHGVLLGLGSIHAKGYIHFDLKPTNVLFDDQDEPMVADFGQACQFDSTGTASSPGVYPGTVPPEVYQHYAGTVQSDIYHAGLTLYRAVNGDQFYKPQVPTSAAEHTRLTLNGKFPNRDQFMPHVPKGLRTAIRKALRVDPADRYSSAADMNDALGRIQIVHDWRVSFTGPTETRWRAEREGRSALVITQQGNGLNWDVKIQTERPGEKPRSKDCGRWAKGQSRAQSDEFLKDLFAELESA